MMAAYMQPTYPQIQLIITNCWLAGWTMAEIQDSVAWLNLDTDRKNYVSRTFFALEHALVTVDHPDYGTKWDRRRA